MIEQDKKIRRGLPPKRGAASFQTQQDIVIPAGTILRDVGDNIFGCQIGIGLATVHGVFSVDMSTSHGPPDAVLKRVVAG